MSKIVLKSLTLSNFMHYENKTFDFYGATQVKGKNGKGKSSIVTAYNWLLFNCDYDLNDNPKVRRVTENEDDESYLVPVSVTGLFEIDGVEVELQKTQIRTKTTKQEIRDGQIVDVVSIGDNNKYFVNGNPVTLKAFNERLGIDIKTLRMCTNINAFLSKKPTEVREYIFSKVKGLTDLDIAKSNDKLTDLVDELSVDTAKNIEGKYKNKKTKVDKELDGLDGEIKGLEGLIKEKESRDVAEMELLKNSLNEQLTENKAKQTDITKQLETIDSTTDGVLELKFKLSELKNQANEENRKAREQLDIEIADKKRELMNAERELNNIKSEMTSLENRIRENTSILERSRNEYKATQSLEFDENSLVCKFCGQTYPSEKQTALRGEFENHKTSELKVLMEKGNKAKTEIETDNTSLAEKEEEIYDLKANIDNFKNLISTLESGLSKIPTLIDISGRPDVVEIEKQIAEKEQAMTQYNSFSDLRKSLIAEENDIERQIKDVEKELSKTNTEIDEEQLAIKKKDKHEKEQIKANYEKMIYLLKELDKCRNDAYITEINSMFGLVTWQMFDYAKNGNYVSTCIPKVDNRSIMDLSSNKGNRILGRIDIINSLQAIEDINTVVFLDDAENLDSGNRAKVKDMVNSQVVMFVVADNNVLEVAEV